MDKALLEAIQDTINDEKELPPDVALRLVLAATVSANQQLDELIQKVDTVDGRLQARVDDLECRVEEVEETQKQNPSMLWLLRFKTKQTVTVILLTFVVLTVLYFSYGRQLLFYFAGIDLSVIPPSP